MREKFKNIFWYDTETTGTNKSKHSIIQMAYLLEVNGKIELERNLLMRPSKPYYCPECDVTKTDTIDYSFDTPCPTCGGKYVPNFDPKAFEVNKAEWDVVMKQQTSRQALTQLNIDLRKVFGTRKAVTAGYNQKEFDNEFLQRMMEDVTFGGMQFTSYFYLSPFLDVYPMVMGEYYKKYYLTGEPDPACLIDFKLKTCRKLIPLMFPGSMDSVQEEKFHDAVFDVKVTRLMYKALVGGIL